MAARVATLEAKIIQILEPSRPDSCMGKMGSIRHFLRALPASIWETLLSGPSYYWHLGRTKQGCDNDTFRAVFPSIWVRGTPKHRKTRETAK